MKYIHGGIGSIRELDLGDGMEIIACQIYRDNKNVSEIVIPNSVIYLNNEAFRNSSVKKVVVGESLITVGGGSIYQDAGHAIEYYLSKNILTKYTYSKIVGGIINGNTGGTVYFDGNLEQATALMEKFISDSSGLNNKITLVNYEETQTRGDLKNFVIFYNYNTCEAFYRNEHKDDNNPCTVNCDRCGYKGYEESPVHNYVTVIAYSNYLSNGTKTQTCQNAGCVHNTTPNVVEVAPIISDFKGFAVSCDGDGITFGYVLDAAAIKEFEEVNKTTLTFGFVAGVKALLGDKMPLDTGATNVVSAKVDSTYTAADFVLRGDWDRNVDLDGDKTAETDIKNVEFYMAGYMIVNGTVVYLNDSGSSSVADAVTFAQCDVPETVE